MGEYYGLAVAVGVALLLSTGQCDVSCKGLDGRPGEAGAVGRDGWPGQKGEKGEPAVADNTQVDANTLLMLRGEMGSRGLQGDMGPKGYRGALGAVGPSGQPGQPGPEGKSIGHSDDSPQQAKSAFSVIRNINTYPTFNQVVTYQRYAVNRPGDFNKDTGHFTCRIPGVYYFVFHSMAKVSMCLRIASEVLGQDKIGFCDYNRNLDQVLSGGVVLELRVGQRVWLESFKEQQTDHDARDSREKEIIFNGFLLFAN